MKFPIGWAFLVLVVAAWPANARQRTLAVLSLDEASRDLADLVAGRLNEEGSFNQVEREGLTLLFGEREVSALAGETAARRRAGNLARADVLVLIGIDPIAPETHRRMILCDTDTGARIARVRFRVREESPEWMAEEVRRTVRRFPAGVQRLLAVSDFVSRDLGFRYAHLTTDLAELLRQSLAETPGLAIVETEEARAIAHELDLAGGETRLTPLLFVEGEYRTNALAEGGPAVRLLVSATDGRRTLFRFDPGEVSLDRAGEIMVVDLRTRLLEALRASPMSESVRATAVNRMVTRADVFARHGDFERAAALREAALLLNPADDALRIALVDAYVHWIRDPVETYWPAQHATARRNDPLWEFVVERCRVAWRRALHHVEYLLMNRRVDMRQGAELTTRSIRSIYYSIRRSEAHRLGDEEVMKKEFIRRIAPVAHGQDGGAMAAAIMQLALTRLDGNFETAEDLDLMADLLCKLLPEETPIPVRRFMSGSHSYRFQGRNERSAPTEVWIAFAQRLIGSPRSAVRAGGYVVLLREMARSVLKDGVAGSREEAAQFYKELAEESAARGGVHDYLLTALAVATDTRDRAMDEKEGERQTREAAAQGTAPRVAAQTSPRPVNEARIRFHPQEITVIRDNGQRQALHGGRAPYARGLNAWHSLVPAWPGTDLLVARNAVMRLNDRGEVRILLEDSSLQLTEAVFDGRYLWVGSTGDSGLFAIDSSGGIAAHVTVAHGLPPGVFARMPLLALGEGRVLVAGAIGHWRGQGWIAKVSLDGGGSPNVRILHEATMAAQGTRGWYEQRHDSTLRFVPDWIAGHRDRDGRSWAYVRRDNLSLPLVIDLQSFHVDVYPDESFPRTDGPAQAYFSYGGVLYVAGSRADFRRFVLNEDGAFRRLPACQARREAEWHSRNSRQGTFVEHEGWLYYAGGRRWVRHHLATGEDEILVTDTRALPHFGDGATWRLAVSEVFGLVGWCHGRIYRIEHLP